jgi:hypothetical protein
MELNVNVTGDKRTFSAFTISLSAESMREGRKENKQTGDQRAGNISQMLPPPSIAFRWNHLFRSPPKLTLSLSQPLVQ